MGIAHLWLVVGDAHLTSPSTPSYFPPLRKKRISGQLTTAKIAKTTSIPIASLAINCNGEYRLYAGSSGETGVRAVP
jgi:hypothetical protein